MTPTEPKTRLEVVLDSEGRKQRWLAVTANVSESYLSKIVSGGPCSADVRARIAAALSRDVGDFWDQHGRILWAEEVPS